MSIQNNILEITKELPLTTKLVAVSKYQPTEAILEAYDAGHRLFGENRPQEMKEKALALPKDIEWHFIGNLQSNKIKMVVPYATLIHSVSSEKLLFEIDAYCDRNELKAEVLLEVHIASEDTKQGFSKEELLTLLSKLSQAPTLPLRHITIRGLMAMASFTPDMEQVKAEFESLVSLQKEILANQYHYLKSFDQLSFGMSNDYKIAASLGSTLVRVGTAIFGER